MSLLVLAGVVAGDLRVDLRVEPGQRVGVVGRSDHLRRLVDLALGLREPEQGTVRLLGEDLARLEIDARRALRGRVGVVLPELISNLTLAENLELPLAVHTDLDQATLDARVAAVLDRLGLSGRGGARPKDLHAGEVRLATVARATLLAPELLVVEGGWSEPAHLLPALARLGERGGALLLAGDAALLPPTDGIVRLGVRA